MERRPGWRGAGQDLAGCGLPGRHAGESGRIEVDWAKQNPAAGVNWATQNPGSAVDWVRRDWLRQSPAAVASG